jgi:hypothetical protein
MKMYGEVDVQLHVQATFPPGQVCMLWRRQKSLILPEIKLMPWLLIL